MTQSSVQQAERGIKLLIDRASVCMGDDIESHEKSFEVQSNDTIGNVIDKILASRYLPTISGGQATWIVESSRPTHKWMTSIRTKVASSIAEHGKPFAVIAQQWQEVRYLVPINVSIEQIIEPEKGLFFNYWVQSNPELVFECLKAGQVLPDPYGRTKP